MCLSIPAKLLEVIGDGDDAALTRTGKVSFGGIRKEISLAYVPEARPGDYVLIHVGFAISIIDEQEAQFVFDYLKQTDAEFEVLP
jgi:hydrogenase expression/formation protein HypC